MENASSFLRPFFRKKLFSEQVARFFALSGHEKGLLHQILKSLMQQPLFILFIYDQIFQRVLTHPDRQVPFGCWEITEAFLVDADRFLKDAERIVKGLSGTFSAHEHPLGAALCIAENNRKP